MPTLKQLKEMRIKLDEQNVPREDRNFHYIDLNGNEQIINHNSIITINQMANMPRHIKCLFIEEEEEQYGK